MISAITRTRIKAGPAGAILLTRPLDSDSSPPVRAPKWRWRQVVFAAYLLALAVSHWQRRESIEPPPLEPGQRAVTIPTVVNDRKVGGEIRLAYRDEPSDRNAPVPVVLIHGSPGDGAVFRLFISKFEGPRRLLAPDLPGFGQSTNDIPDYSFRSHAGYAWEWLDKLGITKVHLVGFSMGGGVVLHMARTAPDRIASITMLSAIGVQEMEMVGDYELNHIIHGAQYAGLKLLDLGLPRFGRWNRGDMGIAYARNFYDSDQRPLRGILERYAGPMLILHGTDDPLVPVEAAREHARLVPQSELEILPSNHFMVFEDPAPLVQPMHSFWNRVEAGTATLRRTALPDRIAQAALPMDTRHWPKPGPVTLLVLFLGLALGTFVSEDLACIGAGVLVAEGRVDFVFATSACLIGILVGDLLLFLAGRWIGRAAVRRAPLRWFLSEASLQRASEWLERNGATVIFVSRFTPGTRLPTYVAAGILHTPFWKFAGYFAIASILWTPLLVGASAGFGGPLLRFSAMVGLPLWIKLILGGVAMLTLVRRALALTTYRGRRGLVGSWRRLRRWEFWPPWAVYPPVVVYILWLAIRYRGATLFTASNPGMPAGGGFVGESKSTILSSFAGAQEWLPAFALLTSEKIDQATAFLKQHRLTFPVVLKPDVGQRGSGVAVVRSDAELRDYLDRSSGPIIIQEYVPGVEYGVFYYRLAAERAGHIFSITEKRMPVLIGDGKRTLERLILGDDRAVCMAELYLKKNHDHLARVPANGEPVQLVELGTHALGSIFLNGIALRTPELEQTIDRIAKTFDGFFFGRFDIRVPSAADLRCGRNLKVVELNGVTSEATHIYDPAVPFWQAYRILFAQWRIAFEIGAAKRAQGHQPVTLTALLRMIIGFQKSQ